MTCCVLFLGYLCALLLISEHKNEQSMQCLLMQLFATSCTEEGVRQFGGLTGVILHNVMWSFQTYFAVLVPLFFLVAGMQITAAGLCKDERRKSRARLLCVNIPYVLTYYVNYMLLKNMRCKQACKGVTISEKAELIFCKEILFFTGALYVSDIVAETVLVRHSVFQTHGVRDYGQLLDQYLTMRISGVFVFCLLRVAQVLSVVIFNWFSQASLQLPSQLVLVHVILASVLAFLDVVQVVLEYAHPHKNSVELPENKTKSMEIETQSNIAGQQVVRNNKPFEIDTTRRKLLTFTGRSRWPAMLNANEEIKERKSS